MNCHELETLLCDYVDGTLHPNQKAEVEGHLTQCACCSGMARDAAAVAALASRAAAIEPPPELVTRILYDLAANREKALEKRRGRLAVLGQWLGPVLQPRFAMGMAMTVLSLAMLARAAHIDVRQLSLADLDPVRVWQGVDDRVHRSWSRAVKFYESLRFVYEIRSRLADLTAQEDATVDSGGDAASALPKQGAKQSTGKK